MQKIGLKLKKILYQGDEQNLKKKELSCYKKYYIKEEQTLKDFIYFCLAYKQLDQHNYRSNLKEYQSIKEHYEMKIKTYLEDDFGFKQEEGDWWSNNQLKTLKKPKRYGYPELLKQISYILCEFEDQIDNFIFQGSEQFKLIRDNLGLDIKNSGDDDDDESDVNENQNSLVYVKIGSDYLYFDPKTKQIEID